MFEIKDKFYLDGKPVQIISGSIHYFRTVPEYWKDRLEKLKNMGCNTVETYIPWNFHETEQGKFNWSGMHDVEKFIQLAQELDLFIIIRPSPFICAEWEFGGLPAWLLKTRGIKFRTLDPKFIEPVKKYYDVLIPKLVPYQIDRGGKIIMIQIENEYGYFGKDKKYLQFYADYMRSKGITVPFVTSDGPWGSALKRGSLKGVFPTGNFGSKVKLQFGIMRKKIGKDWPLMVMEFWCGWFDAWGDKHHTSSLEENKTDLDEIMRTGNVNFYMFEGGTNFGFMNGRNNTTFYGDITSYDYDGVLTQDGKITPKYEALKKIIGSYKKIDEVPLSTKIEYAAYGKLEIQRKVDLFSTLSKIAEPKKSDSPISMEDAGQNYGYILYRTKSQDASTVQIKDGYDRINIYEDKKFAATAFAKNLNSKFSLSGKNSSIDLLVENFGRVNFGKGQESQRKGIFTSVKLNGKAASGFEIFNLELGEEQISKIDFEAGCEKNVPAFYEFKFNAEKCCDTFLNFENFTKGCAFVNGINIGRYWDIGPQKKLYIPAPFIKKGENTIIIFDSEGAKEGSISLEENDEWAK